MSGLPTLSGSLAYVQTLLDGARPKWPGAQDFSAQDAFVDLPDFQGGLAAQIGSAELRTLASLYFLAELEETYLISTAEELSRQRFNLNLTDTNAAQKLEELAIGMQGSWIDANLRNQIFTRVFGIGMAQPGIASGTDFEPRFAQFCNAVRTALIASRWGAAGSEIARAGVAGQAVLTSLAPRVQGNTLIVTERLTEQLNLSLSALNHRGLASLFQGYTAWDVIRGVMGSDVPNLQAQVNLAQTGLRLLGWMAGSLDALRAVNVSALTQSLRGEPQLQAWAEVWLEAAGVQLQQAPPSSLPYQPYGQYA